MPIKFNCAKCKKELVVKDELAGKQGKCPGCQSLLKVPSGSAPASAVRARKPVEDEPVEAEVMDDEPVDADVIDDEKAAPRRGSGKDGKSSSKSSITTSKRASSSRDEDEEDDRPRKRARRDDDDDDDDDDDRPSRRIKSRSRRDEDEDEEDDDEGGAGKKKRDKARRKLWKRTESGVLLSMIGSWVYTGAWAIILLVYLISTIMILAGSRSGGMGIESMFTSGGGFIAILGYLASALYFVSLILSVVGCSFSITTPGKNGEMGLAITCLALNGLTLLFVLLTFFIFSLLLVYLLPILELGRLCLFGVYQWALCKTMRDYKSGGTALRAAIVVPSSAFGAGLLNWLFISALGPKMGMAGGYMMLILMFLTLAGWVGLLVWYTMVIGSTKDAIEY